MSLSGADIDHLSNVLGQGGSPDASLTAATNVAKTVNGKTPEDRWESGSLTDIPRMIPADEPDPLLATTRLRGWLLIAVLFSTVLVIALGFVLMRSATQRTLVIAPNEHHLGGASSFQPSADLIRYAILTLTVRMETWTPQSLEIMADDVLPLFAATKHDEIRGQIQANLAEAKASRMQRACYPLKVMSETASNGVHTVGVALTTSDLVRDPNGLVAISRADDAIVMYTVVLDRPTAGNPLGLRIEALERIPRSVWVGDRHLPDYWTNTP